ncbi:MAG: hypothetical protein ACI4CS_04480 [Candidatus Weimeria sp.]
MNKRNFKKTGAMVLSAMLIAGTGFGMTPASAAEKISDDGMYTTSDYSDDADLQKIFDIYDNFTGGTDEDGEPLLLATNPAATAAEAKTVKKNTVISVDHKKLSRKGYQARVTVDGKASTTVMVPMNAFAKALGGKVKKTGDGWKIAFDGMNVSIVKGEDSYQFVAQKGEGTTAGLSYGSKPVTKNSITYIPVDVFRDVMTNITGNEPSVKLDKKSNSLSFLVNLSA